LPRTNNARPVRFSSSGRKPGLLRTSLWQARI